MKLKRLIFLIFLFSFFFLFFTYFFIFHFLKINILSLEKDKSEDVILAIETYFKRELNKLFSLTKDWAAWNDAYLFMQNKNPHFEKSNIIKETFINLNIDLLLYTHLDGTPKAGGLYDKDRNKIYIDNELKKLINSVLPLIKKNNKISKFIFYKEKPFMLAIYPVLKSDFKGPEVGYLFIGKFVTSEEITNIKNLLQINHLEILKSQSPFPEIKFLEADLNKIILEKRHFLNEKDLTLRITYPVEKYFIKNALLRIVLIQVFWLLLFGLILFLLFSKYIISPLSNLIKEVKEIKEKKKSLVSTEYEIQEIKDLAENINAYIHDIVLREKIYTAIAEKTENLILLFDKNKNIFFQNKNFNKYFNLEEIQSLMDEFLKEAKKDKLVYKEQKVKNFWFKLHLIPLYKDLYLFIGEDITEIKAKEDELFKMATYDFLTDLYNRKYFEDVMERIFAASQRGEKFVLLFIDCDDLKKINDSYGHLIGDEILKKVASAIKISIRKEDIASRWGGDEFTVILHHCKKEEGIIIAQRILENLEKSEIRIDSQTIKPKVSIGLVEIDGTKDLKEIFNLADKLAYLAKKEDKDKIKFIT